MSLSSRMKVSRRDFIRLSGTGALFAGLNTHPLIGGLAQVFPVSPSSPFYEQLASDEYPFPYDQSTFEAAERIANVRRNPADPSQWLTDLNLLIKPGKALDIKILTADRREDLDKPREVVSFTGAQSSVDAVLRGYDSPRLHYQVQYREGLGAWKALPPRSFKLPNVSLAAGGQVRAILIGDDHTFDDADYPLPPSYVQTRIKGDYMVDFLAQLKANPAWTPAPPLSSLQFSFLLIRAVHHILSYEDPDFFIHLGDCNGIGSPYKWKNWGLPYQNLTDADYDFISRTLWLRTRKAFSGLTPNMPVLFALGNHDGESSWEGTRFRAREWRQKLFPQPTDATYKEGGHPQGSFFGFSWGSDKDNKGGAQFLVLDNSGFTGSLPKKPEDWTLGPDQLAWFEGTLARTDPEWRFACFHHVLGGWPSGSHEGESAYAYGRGPLFTAEDYKGLADVSRIEQVKLTDLAKAHGLRAFLYGHDHVFKATRIGPGANQKDLYGVVAGSTKHVGEFAWWQAPFWKRFYGEGFKPVPDFFGPSGITRLTIRRDQAKFEYVCTGTTPNTNLASGGSVAAVLAGIILANPAPAIQVEAPDGPLEFVRDELDPAPSTPRTLRVRNGGGQRLDFSIMGGPIWAKVGSRSGTSCLAPVDISVSPSADLPAPGTYSDEISVEGPGVRSAQVPIRLTINAAPLYPPGGFSAVRAAGIGIVLRWKANQSSRGVTKFRIYLVDARGGRSLIAELAASKVSYVLRKANPSAPYRFALTAVNSAGRESDAAFASA